MKDHRITSDSLDMRTSRKSWTRIDAKSPMLSRSASGLKSSLLNHATTVSGSDLATFPSGSIRPRFARLTRNSANTQHAPIAVTL
jgi:hypothetical protein